MVTMNYPVYDAGSTRRSRGDVPISNSNTKILIQDVLTTWLTNLINMLN